jgi:hypothetical protein
MAPPLEKRRHADFVMMLQNAETSQAPQRTGRNFHKFYAPHPLKETYQLNTTFSQNFLVEQYL